MAPSGLNDFGLRLMLGVQSLGPTVLLMLGIASCGTAVGGDPPRVTVLSTMTGSSGGGPGSGSTVTSGGVAGSGGGSSGGARDAGALPDAATDGSLPGDEASDMTADSGALALSLDNVFLAKSPECLACAQRSCPNLITGCTTLPGMAKKGPAVGVPKADLCVEVVACVTPTGCAGLDLGACYCGVDHPDPVFKCNLPSPCSSVLERGLEATDPFTILVTLTDPTKAGGWAMTLMQCLRDNQCADCLVVPLDDAGDDSGDDAAVTMFAQTRPSKGGR